MGATLPGAVVIPKSYGQMMILYSALERVECTVDGAPPGDNGRLFIIEPGVPKKVPYEAGRFILEHMAYTGVVRVEETETVEGVKYQTEAAEIASLAATEAGDNERFQRYLSSAVEDFVKRGKPVPPPDERTLRAIKRRGYDLKNFGIVPIGWEKPEDQKITDLKAENELLKAQHAELRARMESLEGKGEQVLAGKKTKKGEKEE